MIKIKINDIKINIQEKDQSFVLYFRNIKRYVSFIGDVVFIYAGDMRSNFVSFKHNQDNVYIPAKSIDELKKILKKEMKKYLNK